MCKSQRVLQLLDLDGQGCIDFVTQLAGDGVSTNTLDVFVAIILSVIILLVYIFFYNRIFAVTFDESFASASGIKTKSFNVIFALLTAATIIIGMRIMGTMLISGLIIFPAITGMQLFDSYKKVTVSAAVISVIAFFSGMLASCIFTYVPAGAAVIIANLVLLIVASVIKKLTKNAY